ncbi:NADPH-dependent 2,4-dienoyl-CoA reductase [Bacteroidales bacterium 6E]|nr:NADPH-dependent 2,4-dienoyl-CoA reductase [Bacteroidales bacterium 6E]
MDNSEFEKEEPDLKMGMTGMDRRSFISLAMTAGVGATVGACGVASAGSNAKGKIVIVGGGAAGLTMAALLMRRLDDADITLIDPADRQYYQPGFTLVASGVYEQDEVWRSQESCIPDGVKWIKNEVKLVDPENKTISLANGESVNYDFLVLTPGLQINWGLVEGVSKETLGAGNAHSIYDFEGAQGTWKALQEFAVTGGRGIFTDTYTKHKCGGAPKKICLLTEDYTRKQESRDKVTLDYYTAASELYDIPYFTPRLEEIYSERNIPIFKKVRLKGIDTSAKKAYFEKHEAMGEEKLVTSFEESYDFMHFTPPMSAPDFVRESGLSWSEGKLAAEGWVMTDPETLVHQRYRNIVCLGDCAGIPTSKTSAAVRKQVPVAAANLASLMEGNEPVAKYNGYAACPIITEYGKVLMCEFDYNKEPQITFPFTMLDMSREQSAAWMLKVHVLKPMYFYGMINGYML